MGGQGYVRHQGRVRIVVSGHCPAERFLLELMMGIFQAERSNSV